MSLTIDAQAYAADSFQQNQVGYIGPAKTVSVKDDLILKRTAPKPTSVYSGQGKTTARMTRTLTLTSALTPTGDAIIEVNVSCPVGRADADIDELCDDVGLLLQSADFKTHVKTQKISY